MGVRLIYNAIDESLCRRWNRMGVGRRVLALIFALVAWACVLVGTYIAAVAGYLHYLIHTGQFVD